MENSFRLIIESAAIPIFTVDAKDSIIYANPCAERTFGWDTGELGGHPLRTILPQPGFYDGISIQDECTPHGVRTHTTTCISKTGDEIPVEFSCTRIAEGEGIRYVVIARDITKQLKAERRERELEEHKLDFYRRTILAATDGKLDIRPAEEIMRLAGERIMLFHIASAHDMVSVRRDMRVALVSGGMPLEKADLLILCAGEAMTNALKHAGGGDISLHGKDDMFTMLVSDRGRGIEALNLPDIALTRGYSTAGTLGMGYKLMLSFAGHVYLATGLQGTILGLSMRIHEDTEKPPPGAR